MRKFYLFALVAALFAACTTDVTKDVAVEVPETLTVSFEEDTRIQLMNGKTVWNTGDLVSVFYKSDANDCYRFAGNTGERTSELVRTAKGEKSRSGDHIITVYPYSEDYIISLSAGTIEAHLPAEQTYVNESFGIGSSPMVSMSEYKQVVLKNVCGWLKVQFTGNGEVVDKITLRGNCGEQVAGDIMIVAEDASTILASAGMDIDDTEVGGTLVDEDSIITEVSLICPDGVTLGSEPTSFYIALPPQTFSKGLTVTLYSDKSGAMKQTTDKSITISRNIVQPLASVEANLQPNKIYYTSTDGKIVTPYRTTAFGGANIVSNTYENGQGIITFDAPVTEIGAGAFHGCSSLTSITIPDSVTKIGSHAFENCSSLTSITIPDSVTEIGSGTFNSCSSLTSVTIPDSVTKIEGNAFRNCSSLTSVTIPDSVTKIRDYAFAFCSSLTSVTIGNSVTEIGSHAFAYCSRLNSVYLTPTTPPTLGANAFQYYENGEYKNLDCTIYVPSVALDKYKNAENWSGYNIAANSNELLYTSTDGNIVTPYEATAFGNANIISNTYENGQGIITFDAPVTEIGYDAFQYCSSLTSVTIPDSITEIGYGAFYSCSSLTSVTIPDSVTEIGTWAFNGCSNLTSVTIPDSVTKIGGGAFGHCNSLTSVTIPDSVTTLGINPFEDCSKLTEFNGKFASADKRCLIVDGVLNSFAPAGLTEYTIPDSVTEIGRDAFYGCSSLTSVIIPDSVTKIGDFAFRDCSSLTSVAIPDSVTVIGDWAFRDCSSLTSVIIPDSVTEIGSYAFYGCHSLTSVTIPNSVTKIADRAFGWCSSLTEVFCKSTIPPTLYGNVFESNTSHGLVIYVPKGYLETYKSAAGWCDYASLILEEGIEFPESSKIYYTSTDGNIVAPSNRAFLGANILMNIYRNGQGIIIFDAPVTTIGSYAFGYCRSLTSVTIPDSVTTIGGNAFRDCSNLTSVTIPNNVTEIGEFAFANCSSLTTVTIPDSVTEIGSRAFAGCSSLTSVTIPDSVTKIGSGAFGGCDGLTEFNGKFASADKRCLIVDGYLNSFATAGLTHYTISDSVTKIGEIAFSGCSSLTSVTIPNSVTSIGNYAFSSCSSLTSVIIPYRVTMIGTGAFWRCSSLTFVTIPNSVTEIGSEAFSECSSLTSVTIPDSVTEIGSGAFGECSSLTSVTIPDSVTTLGTNPFRSCSKLTEFNGKFASADKRCLIVDGVLNSFAIGCGLTEYTIPDSVTEIGKYAFGYYSNLTSVTIPDSVTKIADRAFYKCSSITNITIPNLVTSIGSYAFYYCSSLKSVYLTPTTPPQGGSYMFTSNATGRKIYVPRASESAYEAAEYWSDYATDIEPYDF